MSLFILFAALMLIVALACVLMPLLRGANGAAAEVRRKLQALNAARAAGVLSQTEYLAKRNALGEDLLVAADAAPTAARGARTAALAIALLLPAAAIMLYRGVGDPSALDANALATATAAPADHGTDMEQAISKLADKLKQDPNDAEGWALLGRAYEATGRFGEARDALRHAHEIAANDPDVTVSYAEALALSGQTRRIEGEPRRLIEQVLKTDPDHQRALWLLGISEYQGKRYDSAISTWEHLLKVLPKDSSVSASVLQQIANAQAERDGRAPPAETAAAANASTDAAPAPAAAASSSDAHLTIKVALAPKLRDRLGSDDVLFVFAKAASGPPMPLAIQRLPAQRLPVTVTLSDGMGMLPNLKLSQFPQVVIGARVSHSGNAIAQSGDLQTLSLPIAVTRSEPLELTIDQIVP